MGKTKTTWSKTKIGFPSARVPTIRASEPPAGLSPGSFFLVRAWRGFGLGGSSTLPGKRSFLEREAVMTTDLIPLVPYSERAWCYWPEQDKGCMSDEEVQHTVINTTWLKQWFHSQATETKNSTFSPRNSLSCFRVSQDSSVRFCDFPRPRAFTVVACSFWSYVRRLSFGVRNLEARMDDMVRSASRRVSQRSLFTLATREILQGTWEALHWYLHCEGAMGRFAVVSVLKFLCQLL